MSQPNQLYESGAFSTIELNWGRYAVELRVGCRFWGVGGLASPRPFSHALLAKKRSKERKRSSAFAPPKPSCTRPVCIVPATYCAAGVVNDPRYEIGEDRDRVLPGEER